MDYYLLTDLAARLGYELAVSGAETFRVEDSVRRLLLAYGIECEVFAIPNCLVISLETANGKPLSIMKRIGFHGNNLEAVERLNALCRKICAISGIFSARRASACSSAGRCATRFSRA